MFASLNSSKLYTVNKGVTMNKTITAVIIAVVAVAGLGLIFATNTEDSNQSASNVPAQQGSMNSNQMSGSNNNDSILSPREDSGEAVETTMVDIRNFAFSPSTITVKKGSTVTWTNQDSARHDVTPDSPSEAFQGSELLAQGESYSFTFDTVGTYTYFCSPHPYMKATVVVVD